MQQQPTDGWVDKLEALKIGCGRIEYTEEVFAELGYHSAKIAKLRNDGII